MRKSWLLIIALVAIWGLHSWISEDEPVGPAKDLVCEPQPAVQEPPQGLPARRDDYARSSGAVRSPERPVPSINQGYPRQAGEPPPAPLTGYSGQGPDSAQLQGYRFRPTDRGVKPEPQTSPPAYAGQQYGGTAPPAYGVQQFGPTSPPAYSGQQYQSVSPPANYSQPYQQEQASPAYPGEPGMPRYGAQGPVTAGPAAQLRFRPLDRSNRAPRRWTGNYPSVGKGAVPESYGQWALPRGHEGSQPGTWSPPPRNNLLLYNGLGTQDVYSAR